MNLKTVPLVSLLLLLPLTIYATGKDSFRKEAYADTFITHPTCELAYIDYTNIREQELLTKTDLKKLLSAKGFIPNSIKGGPDAAAVTRTEARRGELINIINLARYIDHKKTKDFWGNVKEEIVETSGEARFRIERVTKVDDNMNKDFYVAYETTSYGKTLTEAFLLMEESLPACIIDPKSELDPLPVVETPSVVPTIATPTVVVIEPPKPPTPPAEESCHCREQETSKHMCHGDTHFYYISCKNGVAQPDPKRPGHLLLTGATSCIDEPRCCDMNKYNDIITVNKKETTVGRYCANLLLGN